MRPSLRSLAESLRDGGPVTDRQLAELAAAALNEATDKQLLGQLARNGRWLLEIPDTDPTLERTTE